MIFAPSPRLEIHQVALQSGSGMGLARKLQVVIEQRS
jgi:hypothetical protein